MIVIKTIALGLVVIAAIGAGYDYAVRSYFARRTTPPGRFYRVSGRSMYLYCTGTGSPTVVLEGGLGDTWVGWQQVQPVLSSVTRVCSHDRAGLGFSDPQSGSRDAIHIADQLHDLLQEGEIAGPLVLVGQSAGGLYAREFAAKHPEDVIGLVLVDATPPQSFERIQGASETADQRAKRHRDAWIGAAEDFLGIRRLLGQCRPQTRPELAMFRKYLVAQPCRARYALSWLGEVDEFEKSAVEVAHTTFEATPLLIISQDPDRPKPGWSERDIAANPIWAEMQEQSKGLSKRSRRVIARGSGHRVQNDRPDVVISTIAEFVQVLRNPARTSEFEGSTVIQ